jgi:hypothetical protein
MTPAALIVSVATALVSVAAALVLISAHRRRARAPAGPIMLGGRCFTRVPVLRVAQDEAFMELVTTAGLQNPDILPGEDLKAYSERVFLALHRAKVIRPMLACMILPTGAPTWTPAIADETTQFLGTLDGEDDKKRYYGLVAELLFPFYRSGLASWARSRGFGSSSPDSGSARPASSPAPAPATGGV